MSPMLEDRERELATRRGQHEGWISAHSAARGIAHGRARAGLAARAYAALAEHVREYSTFLVNTHGIITYWGASAQRMHGWSREQATGAHVRLLYPRGGAEDGCGEEHLRIAADTGEYVGEGHRVRADGSMYWADQTLTALLDTQGSVLGFANILRDLTARRAAEGLLQSAAESAEAARAAAVAASAAKSGFLAMMSHEIRTPVNAILGYHQLLDLEIKGPLTSGQREYLDRASTSGHHLLSLIEDVLDFSRIEASQIEADAAPFEVASVVSSVLDLVLPAAYDRGVHLVDEVTAAGADALAVGDVGGVRQILLNLLTNAIKFTTARGEAPPRVMIRTCLCAEAPAQASVAHEGPWRCIAVEDTGAGIAASRQEEMFEPFVQGDMSLTRQAGGTGLGLAISRRLARLMHGDVTVTSAPGEGSIFTLWLPSGAEPAPHTGDVAVPTAEAPPPLNALREVSEIIRLETRNVLHAYVAQLRSDVETPTARGLDDARLESHAASFLTDIAVTVTQIDKDVTEREFALRDGSEIQATLARTHGVQRARLGFTEDEIRRDFAILRDAVNTAIRRRLPARMYGPPEARNPDIDRARALIDYFFASAERISVTSHAEIFTRNSGLHADTSPREDTAERAASASKQSVTHGDGLRPAIGVL